MSERFLITLRALPSSYPAASRLKRFLKAALRSYHLRAERIEQFPDAPARRTADPVGGAAEAAEAPS